MASPPPTLNRFYVLLGAVALVGGALLIWLVQRPKAVVSIPANVTIQPSDTSGFRGYLMGSDSAPVEITEYADYQCPGCAQLETIQMPTVRRQLIETGKVRWRYRDFPLDQLHPWARLAAHAAACADDQGKFWPMHDYIYAHHPEWSGDPRGANRFRDYAGAVGLDLTAYDQCMQSLKFAGRIQASVDEGVKLGVTGTPTLLINGRLYDPMGSDQIKAVVDSLISGPSR